MREIPVENITRAIRDLSIRANTDLGADVLDAFHRSLETETSPVGKEILERLIENAAIAHQEKIPICQDTGMAVVFVEMGQDVHVVGGDLKEAIHEGVRQGYRDGYLRKSVCHPLSRQNTGDNTPAIIHFDVVAGDGFKLVVTPKGFGSENMSRVTMLAPAEGFSGIRNYVVNRVKAAGPNPCPPTTIGVGIGGTLERAAFLAKKALLRPLGSENPDPELAALEKDWLQEINRLGIGPQGLGGRTTALGVHIIAAPCHIASISLAVNIQCHASRHKEIAL
ncbi:MAG: fumarate hydratase [Desulfobacterales bacterium]|nr:fumarate hydratase [Desulfobacterales bacterium]